VWDDFGSGEVTELLVALIRDACVNDGDPDSGQEERAASTVEAYLGEPGQPFEPHPGRRSVLYRVPGTDPGSPSIMLMGHTDVVPVSPDGWSVDPFAGERSAGFVWGRGAVDMLNLTAAMAVVFKQHLDGSVPRLPGDLLYLAVADEEAAGTFGARWLVENEWDAVKCDYLLTEIGTPMLRGKGGAGLPVTVAEKGPQWRRVIGRGEPGHGSQPYATSNALLPVAEVVARLATSPAPVVISDEWRRFVAGWDPGDIADDLLDPDRVDDAIDRLALDDLGLARWAHACQVASRSGSGGRRRSLSQSDRSAPGGRSRHHHDGGNPCGRVSARGAVVGCPWCRPRCPAAGRPPRTGSDSGCDRCPVLPTPGNHRLRSRSIRRQGRVRRLPANVPWSRRTSQRRIAGPHGRAARDDHRTFRLGRLDPPSTSGPSASTGTGEASDRVGSHQEASYRLGPETCRFRRQGDTIYGSAHH